MRRIARELFFRGLAAIRDGHLEVRLPDGSTRTFGDPASPLRAVAEIHDERAFGRFVRGGDIAVGEAYAEGLWSSPDLPSVIRLAVRNLAAFETASGLPAALSRLAERLRHRLRRNTVSGSRVNISYHYDLGNDFYSLFLDPTLTYSCALFERPGLSLEEAQVAKFDRIARMLELSPGDRLLEIGSGWGSFALHAAYHHGCRVTTTTISRSQHDYVRARLEREDPERRVTLLFEDYRRLGGRYDKAVSIEMFEAVGLAYYDDYFAAVDRRLEPGGAMLLQTIWMNETRWPRYRKQTDFIQRHIFPGSELASLSEIRKSLARATSLAVSAIEEIGHHYVSTLSAWRAAFLGARGRVRDLGFPETFIRMWDYYLAYCQGAFAERYIGDAQVLLAKARTGAAAATSGHAAAARGV